MIGIGGSGMYPLAQILLAEGYQLTGSDNNPSYTLDSVIKMGVRVFMGHKPENIGSTELATASFGQRFKVSIINQITAVAAVANGGNLLISAAHMKTGIELSKDSPYIRNGKLEDFIGVLGITIECNTCEVLVKEHN